MSAAYRHYLPIVQRYPAADVPVRGGDVTIARHNVERGVEAIRAHLAEIPSILPKISVKALLELPTLALGLVHADGRVPHSASNGEIEAAFAKVGPLREATLKYLEVVAMIGLVPDARVRAIRAGRGKLDNSRDCVDIHGFFHEFSAALDGKHPFTAAQLAELGETGTWLVKNISPRGAVKDPAARDPEAVIRDRFWKALEEGHDDLRTVGVALFGIKNVDEHVPPLLSRVSNGAPAKPAPAVPVAPIEAGPAPR